MAWAITFEKLKFGI